MADILHETTLIIDKADMAGILTEEVCRYNAFAKLHVEQVSANASGDFVLVLTRKPEEEAA